jgi:putative component of membrane protein insertase Oxa1/YidC/SpoIIIJ protein YidD
MKYLVFLIFVSHSISCLGQDRDADLDLILTETVHEPQATPQFFKGFLRIYKRHISNQLLNDCIYDVSCSAFSQGAISEFGFIKGVFLSADRLTRCNRASAISILPVRINHEGKIRDHWKDYSFSTDH